MTKTAVVHATHATKLYAPDGYPSESITVGKLDAAAVGHEEAAKGGPGRTYEITDGHVEVEDKSDVELLKSQGFTTHKPKKA